MIEAGPISSKCGACGVDLNKVWHADTCPARKPGWNALVSSTLDKVNATRALISAIDGCQALAKNTYMEFVLDQVRLWAVGLNDTAEAQSKTLFPFQERSE